MSKFASVVAFAALATAQQCPDGIDVTCAAVGEACTGDISNIIFQNIEDGDILCTGMNVVCMEATEEPTTTATPTTAAPTTAAPTTATPTTATPTPTPTAPLAKRAKVCTEVTATPGPTPTPTPAPEPVDPTTSGCRGIGDDCSATADCAFGSCSGGACQPAVAGEVCRNSLDCDMSMYYCDATALTCTALIANGEAADADLGSSSCQSGFVDADDNCVARVTLALGADCTVNTNYSFCNFAANEYCDGVCTADEADTLGNTCTDSTDCATAGNTYGRSCECNGNIDGDSVCTAAEEGCSGDSFCQNTNFGSAIGDGDGRCATDNAREFGWEGDCERKEDASEFANCAGSVSCADVVRGGLFELGIEYNSFCARDFALDFVREAGFCSSAASVQTSAWVAALAGAAVWAVRN